MKKIIAIIQLNIFILLIPLHFGLADKKTVPLTENEIKFLKSSQIDPPVHYIKAHDFEGKLLSGETTRLKDFSGKFMLLNFWATWCNPCLKEMPDLEDAYEKMHHEGLVVLAISMGEDLERVRKFLKINEFGFPVIADPEMEISQLYGVKNIPITYLVDPTGVILGRALGPRKWSSPKLLEFFRSQLKRRSG